MKIIDLLLVPVGCIYTVQTFSWNVPVNPGLSGVASGLFLLWLLVEVRR